MTSIVTGQNGRAAEWMWSRMPGVKRRVDWGHFTSLILEKDSDIRAVVIYNNWHPANSIEMHIAAVVGSNWLNRPFLAAAFGFPFVELGLRRVTARIAEDNTAVKKFIEHLGFKPEGRIREGWETGCDMLVYGMLKRECRFIGAMHG